MGHMGHGSKSVTHCHLCFALYKDLLQKHQYKPSQIWNMDESGIFTVHIPGKIVASKGARQVSKITSGERGRTVTVICSMSAAGTFLPPMLIYPRKRMVDALMSGAPPQSVGCCSESGWTDSTFFVKWLEHFVQFTNCSQSLTQIIIMDGHHRATKHWQRYFMPENMAST